MGKQILHVKNQENYLIGHQNNKNIFNLLHQFQSY